MYTFPISSLGFSLWNMLPIKPDLFLFNFLSILYYCAGFITLPYNNESQFHKSYSSDIHSFSFHRNITKLNMCQSTTHNYNFLQSFIISMFLFIKEKMPFRINTFWYFRSRYNSTMIFMYHKYNVMHYTKYVV